MKEYDIERSNAFIETFEIDPYKKGVLSGLSFAVKDIVDISGHVTGCGNPSWRNSQKNAVSNAFCIDQLLSNGAKCTGKTHTDEFAFSLLGENHFYGTPKNPKAPDRVPGGSSSGSASAVACNLVDFAIGTDTGGSIRIPASNCGIWGFRPSHGRISVAGVHPFAPTFDTVGILASTYETLSKTMHTLITSEPENENVEPSFFILNDAFQISDKDVRKTLLDNLNGKKINFESVSFSDIGNFGIDLSFETIFHTYCQIQWAEIWNTHGGIIQNLKPVLGMHAKKNFEITSQVDRSKIQDALMMRESFSKTINRFLGNNEILTIPTSPTLAPKKGSIGKDRRAGDYYPRTLGLTAISGLARLPQISIPFASINHIPIGLSLIAGKDNDEFLMYIAKRFQ